MANPDIEKKAYIMGRQEFSNSLYLRCASGSAVYGSTKIIIIKNIL